MTKTLGTDTSGAIFSDCEKYRYVRVVDKCSGMKRITGRGDWRPRIPNHEQPVRRPLMSDRDSICAHVENPPVEFRDVPEYPGYRVGSDGSIWSRKYFGGWRRRKLRSGRGGYQQVELCRDGVPSTHYVHRLVLLAFSGPCPDGYQACHNNGMPADNRAENLRWDTPKSNIADKLSHGTQDRGENHGGAVVTEAIVLQLRCDYATGSISVAKLGKRYGLAESTVRNIVIGNSWKHVGGPIRIPKGAAR